MCYAYISLMVFPQLILHLNLQSCELSTYDEGISLTKVILPT